jgi:hypothetical protein
VTWLVEAVSSKQSGEDDREANRQFDCGFIADIVMRNQWIVKLDVQQIQLRARNKLEREMCYIDLE